MRKAAGMHVKACVYGDARGSLVHLHPAECLVRPSDWHVFRVEIWMKFQIRRSELHMTWKSKGGCDAPHANIEQMWGPRAARLAGVLTRNCVD